jgi:hypothetical protein
MAGSTSHVTMRIGLDEERFKHDLGKELSTPGTKPMDAVERLLSQQLTSSLREALIGRFIKEPFAKIQDIYVKNKWAAISDLEQSGYETWYLELRFATKPEDAVDTLDIQTSGIVLDPIDYGSGIMRKYDINVKRLKTQVNHLVRLNHVRIMGDLFKALHLLIEADYPLLQPYLANPFPYFRENGKDIVMGRGEFVAFDHMIDGNRVFCSCAKPAHSKIIEDAARSIDRPQDFWKPKLATFLENPTYIDHICHLCVARLFDPDTAAYRYGDDMQEFVEPYANQLVHSENFDKPTARAEVQQQLGLSQWIREAEMYQAVKKLFPDTLVLREASPPWLGRQRLDVYLPELKLALEYQGEQHFRPVAIFGGEKALARNIERDALKRRFCEENNVELICIHFDEPVTVASLKLRLRRFLAG